MGLTKNQEIMVGLAVVGGLIFMTLGSSRRPEEEPIVVDDDPEMTDAPDIIIPPFKFEGGGAIPPLDKKKPAKSAQQIAQQIVAEQQFRDLEEYKFGLRAWESRWSLYFVKRTQFWQFFQTVQDTGMKKFPLADIAKKQCEWLFEEATALAVQGKLLMDDRRAPQQVKAELAAQIGKLDTEDKALWTQILQADKSSQMSDFRSQLPQYTNVSNNHLYQIRNQFTLPSGGGGKPDPME